MRRAEQIEREYADALAEVRFSNEAKERMMKNLTNQTEQGSVKRRRVRPLRAGVIAACLCLALAGTAGAAVVAARQANINFFGSEDELLDAQESRGGDGLICAVSEDRKDYESYTPWGMDFWWNGENGQTLVEETAGTDQDGWTARRAFQYEMNGQTFVYTKYKAELLSDLDGLWDGWDTAWLEENYATVPEHIQFEQSERDGEPYGILAFGEFRGQGGAAFSLQYDWAGNTVWNDENWLTTGLDHFETYTTADGVDATIMTAPSNSGKTLFWVQVISSGHGRFSMFGTQVELDELHTILDSLNLSNLLEYEAVG